MFMVWTQKSNKFNETLIEILMANFAEIGKTILTFIWSQKGLWISKMIWKKKNKGPHIFWIQNILQSYSDETGVIWHKDKHRPSEKNREKYTHIYGEMD